jgi:hypothetical protein
MLAATLEDLQMRKQPRHSDGQRDYKHKKDNASLAPMLSQRPDRPGIAPKIIIALIFQGERHIQARPLGSGQPPQVFPLAAGFFLGYSRRIRDQFFQLFLLGPKLGFALRELLLR